MTDSKKLYRSEDDRILGGVCGGIAEVYDFDSSLVRLVTLLLVLSAGSGLLIYLIAWLIIPTESEVKDHRNVKDVEAEKVEDETEE
jgi:phage shock protein PspC (stress-responsive transcriptional regulator)